MKQLIFLNLNYFLAKLSLAYILFFGFVIIAGYNRNINSPQRQTPQIELLCSTASRAGSKTDSYKKQILPVNKKASYFSKYELFVLLFQNRLVKLKFNSLAKKIYAAPSIDWLITIKTVSQYPGEDSFPVFNS
jgi:hypothetical protein